MQSNLVTHKNPQQEAATGCSELPFTLAELKAAIPAHCFVSSSWKSLFYFVWDLTIISLLYAIASYLDSWFFWPIFWLMQGTMFWALFVVGHDCGHGSFSRHKWLNNLIGHLCHSPILVPFHGWRISHRTHHGNTGNIDTDESWYPKSETSYNHTPGYMKLLSENLFLLAYPLYLFVRSPGKKGSHFLPSSSLFRPTEKWDVITSTTCWTLMVGVLCWLTYSYGWMFFVKFYLGPYLVFVVWLDLVTYLHHTDPDVPWYRGDNWYFLKGALSSIDHDYGLINDIHHNIGTHVVHHIFSTIPHYHLQTANEAVKPILGNYYHKSSRSILHSLWRSRNSCKFVPDTGDVVYYQAKSARAN